MGSAPTVTYDTTVQEQQLALDQERLALEQQAAEASALELELLTEQLAMQADLQAEQTAYLDELAASTAASNEEFSQLLADMQAQEEEAAKLAELEASRAQAEQSRQAQNASSSFLRSTRPTSTATSPSLLASYLPGNA